MTVAVFSSKDYDREFLSLANAQKYKLTFFEPHLSEETSRLAHGFPIVCVFVNDILNKEVLIDLHNHGTRMIALRCAGFNNVDLTAAHDLGIKIARVPAYSPTGVAEHAIALILALNRKINRAYNRVRDGNFSLEGLMGFELHEKTVGVVGTGKIGLCIVRILLGFGCRVIAHDPYVNPECLKLGVKYVPLDELFSTSDIITLHIPLMPQTHHMINEGSLGLMKNGVMLINTSRGGLIDTKAVVRAVKSGHIGYLGLDVYEEEESLFFEDLSGRVLSDDIFARLLTFPNVIITAHQAFLTTNALTNIAQTTMQNIDAFVSGQDISKLNLVTKENIHR